MLVYLLRARSDGTIKTSDSPREVCRKAEKTGVPGIERITELYELETYAKKNVGQKERAELLDGICELGRTYI